LRVLFLKDVVNVANAGDIKEVSSGFARNYLLPKNLATLASNEQLKQKAKITKRAEEQRVKEVSSWKDLAEKLEGTTLEIGGRVGPTGQFYGSISVSRIIEDLRDATGEEVERRVVELSEPIKQPGQYNIILRLHQEVSANITILALAEGQSLEELLESTVEKADNVPPMSAEVEGELVPPGDASEVEPSTE
jgi:large subunit ribosomal protein L9